MNALICDRCGREILPGSTVEFVGPDAPDTSGPEGRIYIDGDVLIVHKTCPEGGEDDAKDSG